MDSTGPETVRIVIADDHPMLRQAVALAVAADDGIEVVGEAADGEQALEICRAVKPDVLVLDLMLPKLDGFEVARRLHAEDAQTRILILTARDDSRALLDSMKAQVDGFLDKSTALETIVDLIREVASGMKVFSDEDRRRAAAEFGRFVRHARASSQMAHVMTDREREVLKLMVGGLTTRQMATRLDVSQRTIESHIKNLYRKLDVRSRVQAVARGKELDLL